MKTILSAAEKQRNQRLKELHQNKVNGVKNSIPPSTPTRLTGEQMSRVNDLREQGMTREDAVKQVLFSNEEPKRFKRNKEVMIDVQIEEWYESQRVNDIYRTEYLRQRQR